MERVFFFTDPATGAIRRLAFAKGPDRQPCMVDGSGNLQPIALVGLYDPHALVTRQRVGGMFVQLRAQGIADIGVLAANIRQWLGDPYRMDLFDAGHVTQTVVFVIVEAGGPTIYAIDTLN